MGYATSNQPRCIVPGVAGGSAIWLYVDGDAHASVDATDYFSDGDDLGMKVDDVVIVADTASKCTIHMISAVTAGGAATMAGGTFS